jgi:hypothetical protein
MRNGSKLYIPQGISEIVDHLAMMMLDSPTFKDDFFEDQNVETVFLQLNEALKQIQSELGQERYDLLVSLSTRMRAAFESDPEDKTGKVVQGRRLIQEMQVVLIGRTL